jgi:hypothetical protein
MLTFARASLRRLSCDVVWNQMLVRSSYQVAPNHRKTSTNVYRGLLNSNIDLGGGLHPRRKAVVLVSIRHLPGFTLADECALPRKAARWVPRLDSAKTRRSQNSRRFRPWPAPRLEQPEQPPHNPLQAKGFLLGVVCWLFLLFQGPKRRCRLPQRALLRVVGAIYQQE